MWLGWFTQNGPGDAGWTAYDPLSDATNTPGDGMYLWIIGVMLAATSADAARGLHPGDGLRRRAPGMTLLRMPVFTWSMLVTSILMIVAAPALLVAMGLLFWERVYGGVFDSSGGPIQYQNLFWFFGHPVVYVMFFPFVGAVGEVIAVFSRRRFFGYRAFVVALLLFTALSTSVWAHHMFATGQITDEVLRADVDGADRPGRDRVLRPRSGRCGAGGSGSGADGLRDRLHPAVPHRRPDRHLHRPRRRSTTT